MKREMHQIIERDFKKRPKWIKEKAKVSDIVEIINQQVEKWTRHITWWEINKKQSIRKATKKL